MKYIYIGVITLFFLGTTGCDTILDEAPLGLLGPDQFYNSETDAIAGLAGVYSHFFDNDGFQVQIDIYFGLTHDLISPTRILGAGQEFYSFAWDEGSNRARNIWIKMYQAVNDVNVVIQRVSESKIPEATKADLIAEGVFLRGFVYYYMTAMYGDVPYLTEAGPEAFNTNVTASRTSADVIRAAIIADIEAVENDLPTERRRDFPQRATQWAAKTLKLKCQLWLKDYQAASTTAQDIVNNSGHTLLDVYADIWEEDNEFNNEIIFALDFVTGDALLSTNRHSRFEPRGQDDGIAQADRPVPFGKGFGFFTVYQSFADTYDENDLRRSSNIFDVIPSNPPIELRYNYIPKQWRVDEPRADSGQNYNFYRLADTYLNLAEAENEANGDTQIAYDAINTVRERAGLFPLENLGTDGLRAAIRQERAWELLGEGNHRKMDILRWGNLEELLNARLEAELANPNADVNYQNSIRANVDGFDARDILLPIPQNEIVLNPNLTQNPGYN